MTVRVQRDVPTYRGVVVRWSGDGSTERPLHFVFLACHSDMADEAPRDLTEAATETLANTVLSTLQNSTRDVRSAIRFSNAAAAETGRYYSLSVGRVTPHDVTIATVGRVAAIVAETGDAIATPNVVRVGQHEIISGAFGIGFEDAAVQVGDVERNGAKTLLITVGGVHAAMVGSPLRDARALIESALGATSAGMPIVAVVR
jgi:hypothetical protein